MACAAAPAFQRCEVWACETKQVWQARNRRGWAGAADLSPALSEQPSLGCTRTFPVLAGRHPAGHAGELRRVKQHQRRGHLAVVPAKQVGRQGSVERAGGQCPSERTQQPGSTGRESVQVVMCCYHKVSALASPATCHSTASPTCTDSPAAPALAWTPAGAPWAPRAPALGLREATHGRAGWEAQLIHEARQGKSRGDAQLLGYAGSRCSNRGQQHRCGQPDAPRSMTGPPGSGRRPSASMAAAPPVASSSAVSGPRRMASSSRSRDCGRGWGGGGGSRRQQRMLGEGRNLATDTRHSAM